MRRIRFYRYVLTVALFPPLVWLAAGVASFGQLGSSLFELAAVGALAVAALGLALEAYESASEHGGAA